MADYPCRGDILATQQDADVAARTCQMAEAQPVGAETYTCIGPRGVKMDPHWHARLVQR